MRNKIELWPECQASHLEETWHHPYGEVSWCHIPHLHTTTPRALLLNYIKVNLESRNDMWSFHYNLLGKDAVY
jgi:hypothetical protein